MKTSPFQIILLAVFGAFAIGGVIAFALYTASSKDTSVGPVTIWGTFDEAQVNQLIQDTAQNDPAMAQVKYVQKKPETYEQDVTRALASDTGPDLIFFTLDRAYVDKGQMSTIPPAEVTPTQFQQMFVDAAIPLYLPEGIVGMPIMMDPLVMYWNKDILATAGVPAPPDTWPQLFSPGFQSIIQRDDAGVITQSLIGIGEFANIDHAKDIIATLIFQAGGSITGLDSQGGFSVLLDKADPQKRIPGLPAETALRFFTEFADPSKNDYTWNRSLPSSQNMFTLGTLALYLGYASEAKTIAQTNPNIRFAIARMPQTANTSGGVTMARVYALGIARTSRNPLGAKTVLYTLATKPYATALAAAMGMVSVRRDSLVQARVQQATSTSGAADIARVGAIGNSSPEQLVIENAAIAARTWLDPDPVRTDALMRTMVESITSGSSQITEAVGKASTELLAIIGQQ